MGTKIRNPSGKFQVHDLTEVGNGWKLYTYESGGTFSTPKATYKDSNGTDAHTNPIIFDSRGEKDIWWDGLYDLKLTKSDGTLVWTMEDFGQGAFEGEARTGPQATTYNMASDADYTLTSTQEGYGRIIITDTVSVLTTGRNIICSTDEKGYYFQNDTAQTLTLKTSAGTGIGVPAGEQTLLFCDGTNVVRAFNSSSRLSAITITPASDADVTLTAAQYAYRRLILADGSWTSGHNIIVPDDERVFYVDNSAGTYNSVIKTSTGSGITVKAGESRIVVCDGTNVVDPLDAFARNSNQFTNVGTPSFQIFTSSGTWNKPANLKQAKITVIGGGGGGGGAAGTTIGHVAAAGGGGGGGGSIKIVATASLGSSETVTVGAGGAGGTSGGTGSTGGTSSFGTHCSATGGVGGSGGASTRAPASGGDGGSGSSGDINMAGGGGAAGFIINDAILGDVTISGTGGNSILGGGGKGIGANGTAGVGTAGGNYGGGGAGANDSDTGDGPYAGGAGAGGIVIVEEYF